MSMNVRKMNKYSQIHGGSVVFLALLLLGSTFAGSWMINTADGTVNSPPNVPSDPVPTNGSTNISISSNLSWTGGDPDGDPVTYSVYFGISNPPGIVSVNQSTTAYDLISMNYNTTYFWKIISWDNHNASTTGPVWKFTTAVLINDPPTTPHTPTPGNSSTDTSLTPTLSWLGGDPDNDNVTYDVYFGTTTSPVKIETNQTETNYHPTSLTYNTTYYWMIVAWDEHNTSAAGPLWKFTTMNAKISVVISKPIANYLYFQDQQKNQLNNRTIVYGPITITANVTSNAAVDRVEFYIDGKLKNTTKSAPYEYLWAPKIQFSLKHNITVVAYDTDGNNASATLNVTKWRFHPLPFIVAAVIIATTFVSHTKVQALVVNLKETALGMTFFAINLRYKTTGPFQSFKGTAHFRFCRVGVLIGPISMFKIGPLHSLAKISFTCLGSVHYGKVNTAGTSQGLLQKILKPTNNC
jgi:hypothetical protein